MPYIVNINVQLRDVHIENIRNFRYSHPGFQVQRRMWALFLKSLVCADRLISEAPFSKILQSFQRKGLEDLLQKNYRGLLGFLAILFFKPQSYRAVLEVVERESS